MSLERNMASVLSSGVTVPIMLVNFIIIIFMEKDFTHGLTGENTKVNGKLTKCTEKEHSPGLMEENILDNTLKTRRKVTESSSGQTDVATEVNG